MKEDTIVAISTALGDGAISIIRLSGKDSIKIVNKIFKEKNLTQEKSHTIHYGHIYFNKEIIDEVLVMLMKGPKTYTRENIVEINCHGSLAIVNKIVEILVLNGARIALPGEFTKRAFLNGRINLIEAEGIMDIISSKTERARKLAINEVSGNVTKIIKRMRKEILEVLANIEVNIDYPEYTDIEKVTNKKVIKMIENIKEEFNDLYEKSKNSKIIKEGINVAIVGKTNVGKSSLLNLLLEEKKAIVTKIKGTTRDIVEGTILIDGVKINLIDTAGLRKTRNVVEKIGIEKTKEILEKVDLVIVVLDGSKKISIEDKKIINSVDKNKRIVVINKSDKKQKIKIDLDYIRISTKESNGILELKEKIKKMSKLDLIDETSYTALTTGRQIGILNEILLLIDFIEKEIKLNKEIDIIEITIKKIWQKLGEIIGETYEDELVDQLFSQFCLGK